MRSVFHQKRDGRSCDPYTCNGGADDAAAPARIHTRAWPVKAVRSLAHDLWMQKTFQTLGCDNGLGIKCNTPRASNTPGGCEWESAI